MTGDVDLKAVVKALKPYGPIPIIVALLSVTSMTALGLGANPWAVLIALAMLICLLIYGMERKSAQRRRNDELDQEVLNRSAQALIEKLEARLRDGLAAKSGPTLFERGEKDKDR